MIMKIAKQVNADGTVELDKVWVGVIVGCEGLQFDFYRPTKHHRIKLGTLTLVGVSHTVDKTFATFWPLADHKPGDEFSYKDEALAKLGGHR